MMLQQQNNEDSGSDCYSNFPCLGDNESLLHKKNAVGIPDSASYECAAISHIV